jgi:hypothetical protein
MSSKSIIDRLGGKALLEVNNRTGETRVYLNPDSIKLRIYCFATHENKSLLRIGNELESYGFTIGEFYTFKKGKPLWNYADEGIIPHTRRNPLNHNLVFSGREQ